MYVYNREAKGENIKIHDIQLLFNVHVYMLGCMMTPPYQNCTAYDCTLYMMPHDYSVYTFFGKRMNLMT